MTIAPVLDGRGVARVRFVASKKNAPASMPKSEGLGRWAGLRIEGEAGEALAAMVVADSGAPSDPGDDGQRVEDGPDGDWYWQAHLLCRYLSPFANGRQVPDDDTISNIGRAYEALFNLLVVQRRAMMVAERWCRKRTADKSLGLEPLIEDLHSLDFSVPRGYRLTTSAAKKILGARRRPVSHATVLATVASAVGAFGVDKGSNVKTAARKLQRAFEATRGLMNEKTGLRRKGVKSPRKRKI
ncbi:MAG: hypothetical protein K0R38_5024 [Polyangiaceae bacterium]|jgi:hypothetical protein|nr:hypothetical protein [Polyangiaceae bacterium]